MKRLHGFAAALLATLSLSGLSLPALADSDHGRNTPLLPAYVQECGACHTPYAPGLLPAASWQRLMGGLPRHFGTDASTDTATQRTLSTWLQQNAGSGKRGREEPPEDRVTRAAWFSREHREFNASTWKRPAIKSPANCSACHTQATQGRFSEHDVRVPQ
jgi:mono/diheme cytochrome c family protein